MYKSNKIKKGKKSKVIPCLKEITKITEIRRD